jgi:predicted permease
MAKRGRAFTERDTGGATPVVIINATMARRYWPDADPLGQRITMGKGLGPEFEDPARQIVGIVADVRENGLDQPAPAVIYTPAAQMSDALTKLANAVLPVTWIVRTSSSPMAFTSAIQREFFTADPLIAIARLRTMDQVVEQSLARQSFNMVLLTIFGGVALLLAAIGIYGLMSYSVEQATHDIGVRLALGAGRREILTLVLGRGMRLAGLGLAIGVASAIGAVRVLARLLFGVRPLDPIAFAVVVSALGVIALLACYLPARRAMAVDPIVALRQE